MIEFLVDHNMEGQAILLLGEMDAQGWVALLDLQFVRLAEVGLPTDSSDRVVWRYAQEHHMLLLTDNRRMSGPDSLERTIREENTPAAVPITLSARSSGSRNVIIVSAVP